MKLNKSLIVVAVPYLLFILSFGFRAPLSDVLLPYASNWDEPFLVNPAIQTLRTGDFNPHFQRYPNGGVWIQLASAAATTLSSIKKGIIDNQHQLRTFYDTRYLWTISNPEIYRNGRLVTAFLGSLLAVFVYYIGKRWYGLFTGMGAGLLVAVSPAMIQHSAYITTDMPAAAFSAASLIPILILGTKQAKSNLATVAVAGTVCSAAAAMKYNAAFTIVPYFTAHILKFGISHFWNRYLASFVAVLGISFIILSPYSILDFKMFMNEMSATAVLYGRTTNLSPDTSILGHFGIYLTDFTTQVLSLPLIICAGVGVLAGFWINWRAQSILITFFAAAMYLFSSVKMHYLRTALPAVPALCLFVPLPFQLGFQHWERLAPRARRWGEVVTAGVFVVLLLLMVPKTIRLVSTAINDIDPRDQMTEFLNGRPVDSDIVADGNLHLFLPKHLKEHVTNASVTNADNQFFENHEFIIVPGSYAYRSQSDELEESAKQLNSRFANLPLVKSFGTSPLEFGSVPRQPIVELRKIIPDRIDPAIGQRNFLPGPFMSGAGLRLIDFKTGAIGLWSPGHLQGNIAIETTSTELIINCTGFPDKNERFPTISITAKQAGGNKIVLVENAQLKGRGSFHNLAVKSELTPGIWELTIHKLSGETPVKMYEPELPDRILIRWIKASATPLIEG